MTSTPATSPKFPSFLSTLKQLDDTLHALELHLIEHGQSLYHSSTPGDWEEATGLLFRVNGKLGRIFELSWRAQARASSFKTASTTSLSSSEQWGSR